MGLRISSGGLSNERELGERISCRGPTGLRHSPRGEGPVWELEGKRFQVRLSICGLELKPAELGVDRAWGVKRCEPPRSSAGVEAEGRACEAGAVDCIGRSAFPALENRCQLGRLLVEGSGTN